ncbi:O-succinylbenzoic acid--CoA ligase [Anoxybacillus voinovskiensis]|uniref:2-succinylbenzoate--CoA ligase n=1 Tax=Anoxybacteroides voinovskiense TaxID=230470 RepID=A0A840E068_9BACL|nr:o-succinylbenzoate--CoA ligase [Anoxybacillus voinovskiensis]MBB4075139.1 O-succinylbenzoic acid--CoA ligase [Anoxybacillus voinovskiensis]GGJ76046.1 2-succinylbenzoate--CoA ligase [Anoxybacillus voinovskiensis]
MDKTPNWLMQRAFLTPNRIATSDGVVQKTFAELHEEVVKKAEKLTSLGVRKGEIVALLMRNRIEMVEWIHALHYLGAVVLLQNVRLTVRELDWQLQDSQARWWIVDDEWAQYGEATSVPTVTANELTKLPQKETSLQQEYALDDIATIMYTSGTTGKPKGVLQTYGNHWWSAIGSVLNLGLREDDCWLAAVPFFHVSGLSILMRSVIYGMSVYLLNTFNAKHANDIIMSGNVTMMSVVSAMLQQMVDELGDRVYPNTFRCMLLGGGPAPKPLLEACRAKRIPVYQTYGMTETASQMVTLAPEYSLSKLGSAGKPLFPAQLRIELEGREARAYEAGEIVVKGPNVTKGYLHRPEATKRAIRDGWLYTGDIGYVDDEGFLYVLDRRSDLIISGGENIYPAEIEAVLLAHEAVEEAGVTGIEDSRWGQVPCAFVKIKEGSHVTEEQLLAFCKQQLANYKLPKRIYIVDHLPRTASQKLVRRELVRLLPKI